MISLVTRGILRVIDRDKVSLQVTIVSRLIATIKLELSPFFSPLCLASERVAINFFPPRFSFYPVNHAALSSMALTRA